MHRRAILDPSVARSAAEMTRKSSSADITVYLGGAIEHPWEEAFLIRLCRDFKDRGAEALILANFNVRGRSGQRQIDFLVLTPVRLAHVELKSLSQTAPVRGRLNGPWLQDLGGGHLKEIVPNPFSQAHNGSYALSDMAARLMDRGEVPETKPFYKKIDTLVCVDRAVPPGSHIERYEHVDVVGYDELLDRLEDPGPRPPWSPEHWDAVIRELGVYLEEHDSPTARRRQESTEVLADYRQRFGDRAKAKCPALVPTMFRGQGEQPITSAELIEWIAEGKSLGLIGESGHGKSYAVWHAAAELTRLGRLVIWLDCGEYTKAHLPSLLGRSTAPYSTDTAGQLAGHAGRVGDQTVIVLDGFNQCPPQLRDDLLAELDAFRLRYRSNVVVTSSVDLPAGLVELTARTELPGPVERHAIATLHGAGHIERLSEAFATPFELATAAACEAELSADATEAELYDAYLRKLVPTETLRSGLRALAIALIDELRTSFRLVDAAAILGGAAGLGMVPEQVDAVLANPLLVVTQGHVRFSHELFGRFLAAEAVVFNASSGGALVEALSSSHHTELCRFVVSIERDAERRADAFTHLADSSLYVSAVRGEMGMAAAEYARAAIQGALADAAFAVGSEDLTLELPADNPFFPRWTGPRTRSANEAAMLTAAGSLLPEGHFVDEVCELLDRTDERLRREVLALRSAGSNTPITTVVSTLVGSGPSEALAANRIIQAAEHNRWERREDFTVVERIFVGSGRQAWSRLYLACAICGPEETKEHSELLSSLVQAAWNARGYHLQLQALQAVQMCGRSLDESTRNEMEAVLTTFETTHPFLQSAVVEALAAIDRLGASPPSVEELADFIRVEVLAMEDGPDAWRSASGICSSQWEPDDIVGPYYEAVHSLTESEQFVLFLRAARCDDGVGRSWPLEQLCYATPTSDPDRHEELHQVFADAATGPPSPHGMIDENYDAHVYAVRGLGRLGSPLPPCENRDPDWQGWHLVDQLIVDLEAGADSSATWSQIIAECPWPAIGALFELRFAGRMAHTDRKADAYVLGRLLKRFPRELRMLFEWGLAHRAEASGPRRPSFGDTREGFMVRTLGMVGDAKTVELLRPFLSEPSLADEAAKAIRELNS